MPDPKRLEGTVESEKLRQLRLSKREFLKASAGIAALAFATGSGLMTLMPLTKAEGGEENKELDAGNAIPLQLSLEGASKVPVVNQGEAIVKLLKAFGVKAVFCSVDDEINAILDALTGDTEILHIGPILHEKGAIAAADGYAAASGKLGVALIGGFVGNEGRGGVINAYYSYRPILIIGAATGTTNYSTQNQTTHSGIFDPFTKMNFMIDDPRNLVRILVQGYLAAQANPPGPVFINTYQSLNEGAMPDGVVDIPPADRLQIPQPSIPTAETLKTIAQLLVDAESPLIMADYLGRNKEAVPKLVELAETLAIPVVESGRPNFLNFPWNHPLHLGFDPSPYLKNADVVLVLDASPPATVPETAKVILLSFDPVKAHQLIFLEGLSTPPRKVDISVVCDTNATLPALKDALNPLLSWRWDKFEKYKARFAKIKEEHDKQRKAWMDEVTAHLGEKPISPQQFYYDINSIVDKDTIVLNGIVFSSLFRKMHRKYIALDVPGSYIDVLGGAGLLDQAPFASIGVAVACPDKKIISLISDGGFQWGHGDKALWLASRLSIPVLYIIENNHCLTTTKNGQIELKGKGESMKNYWAQDLTKPMLDFTYMAKGAEVWAKKVEDPADYVPTLREALDVITKQRKPALVDVWTKPVVGVDSWLASIESPKLQ
jgi:acetolactate synthase-1/2/3 large subunit